MYASPKFRSGFLTQLRSARRFLNVMLPIGELSGSSAKPSQRTKRMGALATQSLIRASAQRSIARELTRTVLLENVGWLVTAPGFMEQPPDNNTLQARVPWPSQSNCRTTTKLQ